MNGKGTRDEWRKRIGKGTLKEHKLHELIRTREWTFLSGISTSGELGTKGTRILKR